MDAASVQEACGIAASCLLLAVVLCRRRRLSSCNRRWWVRPYFRSRGVNGDFKDYLEMRRTDGELHFKHVRMSPMVFNNLLALVVPYLKTPRRYRSRLRAQISSAEKLVLTLQFFASVKSM